MGDSPEIWTTTGLLDHIKNVDQRMEDRTFAFLLGAGASLSSDLPSNDELVKSWLAELQRRLDPNFDTQLLQDWATSSNLGIDSFNFQNAAAFLPHIFKRRFHDDLCEGHAYIENIIEGKEPSLGYLLLSQFLTKTRHRIVISSNYDNLLIDAMAIYGGRYPLIGTHENLANMARTRLKRPLVAKISGDLLHNKLTEQEHASHQQAWQQALSNTFERHTPIIIGYENNEGGVLDFLENIKPGKINGNLFWCYSDKQAAPSGRVESIVKQHRGKFVPIKGFDEFMGQLNKQFHFPSVSSEIEQKGLECAQRYRHDSHTQNGSQPSSRPSISKSEKSGQEDAAEPAPAHITKTLVPATSKNAINKSPSVTNSSIDIPAPQKAFTTHTAPMAQLGTGSTAVAAQTNRGGVSIAEEKNIEVKQPQSKLAVANKSSEDDAWTTWQTKIDTCSDNEIKEALYRDSLKQHPECASLLGGFADFLSRTKHQYNEAENLFKQAISIDSDNINNNGNYAYFMATVRKDFERAEFLFRQTLKQNPQNLDNIAMFANFMAYHRKHYDAAERLYHRALELAPNDAASNINYAAHLVVLNNLPKADEYAEKAWNSIQNPVSQLGAEVAFLRTIVAIASRQDMTPGIGRLKTIIDGDFLRKTYDPNPILQAARYKLVPADYTFTEAIAVAIKDPNKTTSLEQFSKWRETESCSLSTKWGK